ncbi:CsgE family curli-type amyloid fiber assembly protein [Pontibacter pamirensis]|uniref:CsgE family curli-type amyloid fiber assembly protein n=1 Tax=Pontibacter pamirensis TaxID=2562824 RepID=UPI00138A43B0|nr:CsgE family curli-type amyloid fiber assembly protein [Pontibacter pamirensis]
MLKFICLLLLTAVAGEAYAQQQYQTQPQQPVLQDSLKQDTTGLPLTSEQLHQYEQNIRSSADLEIDGLIVDNTITKAGRDFYEVFQRQWEAPPMARNFTIEIEELPARGNITVVSLSVNEDRLFEQPLQPRYDIIEEVATYMVGVVYEYLVKDQLNKQLEAEGKKEREVF